MKKLIILGTLCLLFTISAVSQSRKEWEKVQSFNSWNVYQQFILNYPNGKYTEQAKQKQSLLKQPEQVKKVEPQKSSVIDVAEKKVTAPVELSNNNDLIVLKKKRYYLNDKQLSIKELKDLLYSKEESADMYKKAMNNTTVGVVLLGVGTAFIIYAAINPPKEEKGGLPGLISDEEMSKWMVPVYISGGCILASLPFVFTGKAQLKKSITIYNSKQTATGYRNEFKLDIGLTRNGVGVTYHF